MKVFENSEDWQSQENLFGKHQISDKERNGGVFYPSQNVCRIVFGLD